MDQLAELNREYQEKFGFIYIICATGKSAEEMLALLKRTAGQQSRHRTAQCCDGTGQDYYFKTKQIDRSTLKQLSAVAQITQIQSQQLSDMVQTFLLNSKSV